MSGKNQVPVICNWQSTNPITGFLPLNNQTATAGSIPSGVVSGTMSGTNTIYSQILNVGRMDNIAAEFNWTGTAVGSFKILASNSGANFSALTFNPVLPVANGADGLFTVSLNQFPYRYILFEYTNESGSGVLEIVTQQKDLN